MIEIRCCSAAQLLTDWDRGDPPRLIFADPPWPYDQSPSQGSAADLYDCPTMGQICADVEAAYEVAPKDTYLALWATFPKLEEWFRASRYLSWEYLTGGAWGKTNGLGIGFHFRGDAELLLLYRKGRPKPRRQCSNLWLADRKDHSQKPAGALKPLLELGSSPGDLVLDLYAGESASLAICCRQLGRRYIGAELGPDRHRRACERLSQMDMFDP